MILVDANVPMYLVGADQQKKDTAATVLRTALPFAIRDRLPCDPRSLSLQYAGIALQSADRSRKLTGPRNHESAACVRRSADVPWVAS